MARITTGYESYTSTQLHSFFTTNAWRSLDADSRLSICQEVENRLANARGTEPREVISKPMNGAVYGEQYGDTIAINSHILNDNVFRTTYTDFAGNIRTRESEVLAPGWETLDTVNHEDMHGFWEDQGIMPDTYIQYDTDADLYRIQGCEKAAFLAGEKNTLAAIQDVVRATGVVDPDAQIYLDNHMEDSYRQSLENAARNYNDPNIEATLNTHISNTDQGIEIENPSFSYDAIDCLYSQQCYDNFYGENRSVVSNQALTSERETVNNQQATSNGQEENYGAESLQSETISEEALIDGGSQLEDLDAYTAESAYMADDGCNVEGNGTLYAPGVSYDASNSYGTVNDGSDMVAGSSSDYQGGGSYDSGYDSP